MANASHFRFLSLDISFNFMRRPNSFLLLLIMGQTLSVLRGISSFLLLLIIGQTFSVPRSISVNAAEKYFEDVALDLPSDLASAKPKINAHQEAPLSHVSETANSNVDEVDDTPGMTLAQSRLQGLQHLPTELLLEIANHLPPSSIIFLTRTCRRIHHNMDVSFEQLLGGVPARRPSARGHLLNTPREQLLAPELHSLSFLDEYYRSWVQDYILGRFERPAVEKPRLLHSELLIFLCMLERNGQIDQSRAVCSSCVGTHDISVFAPDSLNHQSDRGECLGRAGSMWICPHWQCSYDEVHSYSTDRRPLHACGAASSRGLTPFVASICGKPMVRWPLIELRRGQALPSNDQEANLLRPLTASACPHFKMNDHFDLRRYSPDCGKLSFSLPRSLLVPCICQACLKREPDCPECGAEVFFDVMEDYAIGNHTLEVFVQRNGGEFNGVTDPGWIKQLAFPADFEWLEQAWNESACRLGPNKG